MTYINPPHDELWTRNGVANGTASRYQTGPHDGTLSIKSMIRGRGDWTTPDGRYSVDAGSFLVVNDGQSYDLEIDSRDKVETFAVFFRPGFVEDVRTARNLGTPREADDSRTDPYGFYERLNPKSGRIGVALDTLYSTVHQPDVEDWEVEECFVDLANALIDDQDAANEEPHRLDLARAAVRDEIHRRLARARDCLLSANAEKLDLTTVAREACLSPYYFHRLFASAFGQTPHQFLTQVRVQRATRLLRGSDKPVWAIALDTGFESTAHFCRLYKKATGLRPTEVRQTPQD